MGLVDAERRPLKTAVREALIGHDPRLTAADRATGGPAVMRAVRRLTLVPFAALLSLGTPAEATHEVTHRYVVLGYVRDAARRPIAGSTVEVVREKTGLSYFAETDAEGFYVVVVHLQDEDLLDALRVTAGRATIRIRARFNPLNSRSHRGTRVDFTGGSVLERQETFAETLNDYLKR